MRKLRFTSKKLQAQEKSCYFKNKTICILVINVKQFLYLKFLFKSFLKGEKHSITKKFLINLFDLKLICHNYK